MALPLLKTPKHELTIPSTGEKIEYRPFLVGEEKSLLLALETGKDQEISEAVIQTVKQCTFDKVEIKKMPMFDIEYVFLNIRMKSAGSEVEVKLLCLCHLDRLHLLLILLLQTWNVVVRTYTLNQIEVVLECLVY